MAYCRVALTDLYLHTTWGVCTEPEVRYPQYEGLRHHLTLGLSVRPSVPCLRFSRNGKVVQTSNLVETRLLYKNCY